jgi:hypothetical protein
MRVSEDLLNGERLAEALHKNPAFVTAMKRAGYVFKYKAANLTTLEHALEALRRSPEFVAAHYRSTGWQRLPQILAEPSPSMGRQISA